MQIKTSANCSLSSKMRMLRPVYSPPPWPVGRKPRQGSDSARQRPWNPTLRSMVSRVPPSIALRRIWRFAEEASRNHCLRALISINFKILPGNSALLFSGVLHLAGTLGGHGSWLAATTLPGVSIDRSKWHGQKPLFTEPDQTFVLQDYSATMLSDFPLLSKRLRAA